MLDQVLSRFQKLGARAYVVGSQESEPEEVQRESYEKPAGSPVPDSYKSPGSFYLGVKESYALWAKNHGPNRYARLFDKFTKERPSYRIRVPIPSNIKADGREERPFSALEADVVDIFHGTQYSDVNFSDLTVFDTKNKRTVGLQKALEDLNRTERSAKLEQLREADRIAMLKELKFNTNLPAVPEDRNSPKRFDPRFADFKENKQVRDLTPKESGQLRALLRAIEAGQVMPRPGQDQAKWPSEAAQFFDKAYEEAHQLIGRPKTEAKLVKLRKTIEAYLAKNKTFDRSVSVFDAKWRSEDNKRIGELRKKIDNLEASYPDPAAREKAAAKFQKELLEIQQRQQQEGSYDRDLYHSEVDKLLKLTFIDKLKDKIAEDDARNPRAQLKAAGQAGFELVVSRYPTDVLHMSTHRYWDSKSCMRLQWSRAGQSSPSSHVYKAVEHGGLVVYGCRKGDMNLDAPVCRTLLFPFQNVQDKDDIILMPISRVYRGADGVIPPNFLRTLYKLLDAFNDGNKGGQYSVFQRGFYTGDLYKSGGVDVPAIKVGTEAEQKDRMLETLAELGVTKFKVRPDGKVDVNQDLTVREGMGIAEGALTLPLGVVKGNFCVSPATMRGGRNQTRSMEDDGFKPYPEGEGREAGYEVWKQLYANSPSSISIGAAIGLSTCIGFPEHITGDLRIRGTALINLEGASNTTVGRNVILEGMPNLQSLNGFPKSVGGDVVVAKAPKMQSLSGLAGVQIPGNFMIIHTNIRFLDAKPVVGKSWCLSGNYLRTTVGIPSEINGDLLLNGNRQLRDLKDFPRMIRGSCSISRCTLRDLKGVEGSHIEKNFFINGLGLETLAYFPAYVGGTCQCAENRLPGNTPIPPALSGPKSKFLMGDGFGDVDDKAEQKAMYERHGGTAKRDIADQRYYNQFHPDSTDFTPTTDDSTPEAREKSMVEDRDQREKEIAGDSSSNYKNGDIHLGVYKHPEEGMGVD